MTATPRNLVLCADLLSDRPEAAAARTLLRTLSEQDWTVEVKLSRVGHLPAAPDLDPVELARITNALAVSVPCGAPALLVASITEEDTPRWVEAWAATLDSVERMAWVVRADARLPAGFARALARYDRFFVADGATAELLARGGVTDTRISLERLPPGSPACGVASGVDLLPHLPRDPAPVVLPSMPPVPLAHLAHDGARTVFHPDSAPLAGLRGVAPFVVLAFAGPGRDSSIAALVRAFRNEFAPGEAELWLKALPGSGLDRPAELGADGCVRWIDRVLAPTEMPGLYLAADAFADLRPDAVRARGALEAMICGLPVLATCSGRLAELVGEPGVAFPVDAWLGEPDPASLAARMREVCTDRTRAREIGARGRRRALSLPARVLGARTRTGKATPPLPARTPRASDRPLVVMEGPLFELSSAALFQRATIDAVLARDEVDLVIRPSGPFRWPACEGPPLAGLPERVLVAPRRRPDLWIRSGWPPRPWRPDARRWVVRFDWEYGALPRALADTLANQADEVWTHSRAVAGTCTDGGVPPGKVRIVPHGVDPRRFRPGLPPLPEIAERTRGAKVILFVGEAIWRKGIDLLLSAYGRAFTANDPVVLVVKEMGGGTSYEGFSLSNVVARLAACAGAPRVLHLTDPIPAYRMGSLYAAADVLVHPYRGEGFGLPVLEARACGVPVLVTRGGATDDFTDGEACVHLKAARRTIALPEPMVGLPWVLEPDLDDLVAKLRLVVGRSASLREHALAEAESVARDFSWDHAARAVAACAHGVTTGSEERMPAVNLEG